MKLVNWLKAHPLTTAIILLSVVAHTWILGRRPMAHDEAIDAWFSWQARGMGVIKYDPVYHGPLRFYLEGFVLSHFGTTPGWTRLIAALAGIGATIMIATSRRLLGNFGAPFAALLFTISPTILTVTRTGREDSLTGLVSLALLLVVANGLKEPRPRHIVGAGALLAVSLSLKETTFIFGLVGACFFLALAVAALMRPAGRARGSFHRVAPSRHAAVDVDHGRVHCDLHGRVHVGVPLRRRLPVGFDRRDQVLDEPAKCRPW